MKTDTLFHELFRQWPALALDLAGLDPAKADRYSFRSEELKQAVFQLDGVLTLIEDSDHPYVFIEVQFQPDETLYRRLLAEIFLYLQRAPQSCDWRTLVLYPTANTERILRGYASLMSLPEVQRVDLSALSGQDSDTPGWELLRLIVDDTDAALARAARMIQRQAKDLELLNFIETVLVYKLPRSTREEIQAMLGLTDSTSSKPTFTRKFSPRDAWKDVKSGKPLYCVDYSPAASGLCRNGSNNASSRRHPNNWKPGPNTFWMWKACRRYSKLEACFCQ